MNCVLLSEKRTGSTFLQTALNSHPQILSLDELFMPRPRMVENFDNTQFFIDFMSTIHTVKEKENYDGNVKRYLKNVYKKEKNVVFRLMYPHIKDWKHIDFVKVLKHHSVKIIHLRRNFMDITLSMKLKKLHKKMLDNGKVEKIHIDVNEFRDTSKEYRRKYNKYNRMFNPELELYFDNILQNTAKSEEDTKHYGMFNLTSPNKVYLKEDINKKLCDFFGVDNVPMYSYITKFIENKWQYIKNVDEIRNYYNENKDKF